MGLVFDLFSGVGGLGLGFRAAGFDVVGFELDVKRAAVFSRHIGPAVACDLRLAPLGRGRALGVVAGPPCRPYSKATPPHRKGYRHPEHGLDMLVAAVARAARPLFVVAEEVPGWDPAPLAGELEAAGYAAEARLVDFSEYGVPVARRRWVLVALRGGDPGAVFRALEAYAEEPPRPVEVLAGLPPEPCASRACAFGGSVVYDHVAPRVRSRAAAAIPLIPPGHSLRSAHRAGLLDASKYVADPAKLASYKFYRVPLDRPAKVVPHPRRSVVIHPAYDRPLTVRELARLHTYPDWFSFEPLGVDAAMRAIADSVPPKFSEKLARAIKEALQV